MDKNENRILTDDILLEKGFVKTGHKWVLLDDCKDAILTLYRIANAYCTNLVDGMTLSFRTESDLELLFELMGKTRDR